MAAAPDNTDIDWRKDKTVLQCNKYMYENEVDPDVSFLVGPGKEVVSAHKYVLISRSSVFYAMLSGPLANTTQNIEVPDIDPDIFRKMLQYMYYEDTRVEMEEAYNVLYAAKKYCVDGLIERCVRLMRTRMTQENVCWILAHAELYNDQETKQACLDFLFRYAATTIVTPGFSDLSFSVLEEIIKANRLNLPQERIFEALQKWSEKECQRKNLPVLGENQRNVLGRLLDLVDFLQMDINYFSDKVSHTGILPQEKVIALFRVFVMRPQPEPTTPAENPASPGADNPSVTPPVGGAAGTEQPRPAVQEPAANISRAGNSAAGNVINIHNQRPPAERYAPGIVPLHERYIVKRFRQVLSGKAYQRDNKDCLSFIPSANILLVKVLIFGSHQKAGQYRIEFRMFEDGDRSVFYKNLTKDTDGALKEYEIDITPPLRLQQDKVYTLDMLMKGPVSFYGAEGMHFVAVNEVNFTFVTNEEGHNGTNIRIGQFAGLVFEKCQ